MVGWEALLAAVGGMVLGMGITTLWHASRDRVHHRSRLAVSARIRRRVIPALERRADQLGIPLSARRQDLHDPTELAVALASAIEEAEHGADLAFKDTVEVPRSSLGPGRTGE
ncbi:MAG: hypothetical protein ACFCGT_01305 [Sandaracinaceae bacterium]